MKQILFICAIALGFTSCKKDAGEGGTSVIEGQVYKIFTFDNVVNEFDSLGNVDTTYLVLDTLYYQLDSGKDVFLIILMMKVLYMMINLRLIITEDIVLNI